MKGKLNKQGDRWVLYNEDSSKIALSTESPIYKLSLKNCQAIECGYDLDELAEKYFNDDYAWIKGETAPYLVKDKNLTLIDFKKGFQKALEILGDKKFSELDMRIAYDAGCNNIDADDNIDFQDTINSLQQTEWDVEIVIGTTNIRYDGGSYITANPKPKLDENGCLILKS